MQTVNSLPSHLSLLRGARLFVDMSRLSCRDPDLWRTVARCYDAGIRFDTHLKINGLFHWHHSPFSHSRCDESSFKQRRQRNASTEQTLCCLRWGVIYAPHTGMPSSLYVTKFQSLALHKDGRRFQFRKGGQRESTKELHSIVWPAGMPKVGRNNVNFTWFGLSVVAKCCRLPVGGQVLGHT